MKDLNVSFLPWVFRWLNEPEALSSIEPGRLLNVIGAIIGRFPEIPISSAGRATLAPLVEILDAAKKIHAENSQLLASGSIILRRMGEHDKALDWVEQSIRCGGGYMACVAKAGIYRAKGDVDSTVAAFNEALKHQDEPAIWLDIGDVYLEHDRLQESAAAYEMALRENPEEPWALPSLFFVKNKLDSRGGWDSKLEDYARTHPGNERARFLSRGSKPYEPYIDFLPEPQEATVNMLRQIVSEGKELGSGSIRMALSHLEAPSAFLAFDMQMEALGNGIKLDVSVGKISQPDPRLSRGDKEFQAWVYPRGFFGFKGTTAQKGQKPPPSRLLQALSEVAVEPYSRERWLERCGVIGNSAGEEHARDLIAAMVYPPPLPFGRPAWIWLMNVQFAAALSLAFVDSGWEGSLRRKALLALLRGPVDWTISAAILALTEISLQEPRARNEIKQAFTEQFKLVPKDGFCTYVHCLVHNLLRLPNLTEDERREITKLRRDLDSE